MPTRTKFSKGFYKDLNDASSCFIEEKIQKRRKILPGFWLVDRIIASRNSKVMKNEKEYLIKWKNWPLDKCSWEPEGHLTEDLISNFHKGNNIGVEQFGEVLQDAILKHLKSSSMNPQISVRLPHDVWRYVFYKKGRPAKNYPGWILLEKDDFKSLNLPDYWWYCLDCHGQGKAISFPLRAKTVLSYSSKRYLRDANSNIVLAPRKPVETVIFFIARCQRGVANVG